MAADPDAIAKSILATVSQIDTHIQSIAKGAAAAAASLGGVGGGQAGASGGFGGTGSSNAGAPAMPAVAGSGGGGHTTGSGNSGGTGGSGPGRLGLGTVAAAAGAKAIAGLVSGSSLGVLPQAAAADILSNQFAIQGGNNASLAQINQRKAGWMSGGGLSGFNGYNSQDNRTAASVLATQYAPSLDPNSAYQRAKRGIGAETLNQPGLSATSIAAFSANTAAPQTYNSLRLAGITATDKNGNGLGPSQLAANILRRIGGKAAHDPNLVRRALMTGGALDQQLTAAGITGDQRVALTNDLLAQASGNTSAQGNTIDKSTKQRATAADNKSLQLDKGVVRGAEIINDAATKFNQGVADFLRSNQTLANAIGRAEGGKAASGGHALGGLAGLLAGQGPGGGGLGFSSVAKDIAKGPSGLVNLGKSVFHSVFGGSNSAVSANGGMQQLRGGGTTFGVGGSAAGTKQGGGNSKQSNKKVWPVGSGGITQPFGGGPTHNHPGTDFARPLGTPIHAAADGVVIFAGPASGFGNMVGIYHPQFNMTTRYGHEKSVGVGIFVKQGQQVKAGDTISAVGSEGESTGPHVHVELANGSVAFGNYASNRDVVPWLGGASTSSSGTPSSTTDTSGSSSSSSSSSASVSSGPSGFSTLSLNEGLTSSLLQGGAVATASSAAGSSSNNSTKGSGTTSSGATPGGWAKKLPAAGQQYASLIQAAAHATGVNPALIAAVMNTESGFHNYTTASSDGFGSLGLMQFIPSTGKAYGLNSPADNENPAKDILAGAKYLKVLLGESGGNVGKALAGYNSGNVNNPDAHYVSTALPTFDSYGGGAGLGSYAKGSWNVGRDQLAQIHQGEMIVPSNTASMIRNGSGGSGAIVHIHVNLANASNAEAMRLAATVQQQLSKGNHLSALASS